MVPCLLAFSDTITISDNGSGTGTTTWTNDNTYLLSGPVYVNSGDTLTIEPGTVIKGLPGTLDSASALIVARGAKIFAEGTPTAPIIFTSSLDSIHFDTGIQRHVGGGNLYIKEENMGLWGGVVILGNGKIARDSVAAYHPGLARTPRALYGGLNDEDHSGSMAYVSIRFGGVQTSESQEITSLFLCGVGSQTEIHHIETVCGRDDGIECWGGTVNLSYLLSADMGDDLFDFDQGYRGKMQFLAGLRNLIMGDAGFEIDGGVPDEAQPYGEAIVYNASVITPKDWPFYGKNILIRDNAAGTFANSVFLNGEPASMLIEYRDDNHSSYDWLTDNAPEARLLVNNCVFDNTADGTSSTAIAIVDRFQEISGVSSTLQQTAQALFNDNLNTLNNTTNLTPLNPIPVDGLTGGVAPNDPFLESVNYQGAFQPNGENWAYGWSLFFPDICATTTPIWKVGCESYSSPSGRFEWNSSGVYYDLLTSTEGCDSILRIDLVILEVDLDISVMGSALVANTPNAEFQWIDCTTGMPIDSATGPYYLPADEKEYAVVIDNGTCVDTTTCAQKSTEDGRFIVIQDDGNGTGTTTWTNDKTYLLSGRVFVNSGDTLTIEPGTVIKGLPGVNEAASMLVVSRGAKIFAEGTPESPIIFTSSWDDVIYAPNLRRHVFGRNLTLSDQGLWGGLMVLGDARIAASSNRVAEGFASGNERAMFGGENDLDYSGRLAYISIRHGGTQVDADSELSGFFLCGVGSATSVHHIESVAGNDDGFEFLGGTVNAKYLLSAENGDDLFDFDLGYRGKVQYAAGFYGYREGSGFFRQGDVGFEVDGGTPDDATPYSEPVVYNATIKFSGAFDWYRQNIIMRDNTAGTFANSIFSETTANSVLIEYRDNIHSTYEWLTDQAPLATLLITNNVFGQPKDGTVSTLLVGVDGDENPSGAPVGAPALLADHFTENNNTIVSDLGITGPSPIPTQGMDNGILPTDPFFDPVSFQGAFEPNGVNWAQGWSLYYGDTCNAYSRLFAEACDRYESPSGNFNWTASGQYFDVLPKTNGCDSIICVNLVIPEVDTRVVQQGQLEALASDATFQWYNCDKSEEVVGATSAILAPVETGQYAVIVQQNGCVDTSDCYLEVLEGIYQAERAGFHLYPNPGHSQLFLEIPEGETVNSVEIFNSAGTLMVGEYNNSGSKNSINVQTLPQGLYTIAVKTPNGKYTLLFMKE